MKGQQVVLGHIGNAKVAALLVDGILHDVLVEDLNRLPLSSLLRAVVDRPVKGIGGVILRLPTGTGLRCQYTPRNWRAFVGEWLWQSCLLLLRLDRALSARCWVRHLPARGDTDSLRDLGGHNCGALLPYCGCGCLTSSLGDEYHVYLFCCSAQGRD